MKKPMSYEDWFENMDYSGKLDEAFEEYGQECFTTDEVPMSCGDFCLKAYKEYCDSVYESQEDECEYSSRSYQREIAAEARMDAERGN